MLQSEKAFDVICIPKFAKACFVKQKRDGITEQEAEAEKRTLDGVQKE